MKARGASVRQVIQVTTVEGQGVDADIMREVMWFYGFDGSLLAVQDPADGEIDRERKMPLRGAR